jgi:hypothetical protein
MNNIKTAPAKKRATRTKLTHALDDLQAWLQTLHPAIKPSVHVNGKDYPACVLTVDFGTPLEPFELNSDQATELPKKIRAAVREIFVHKDIPDNEVRIWNDANGVWWSGIKHWN